MMSREYSISLYKAISLILAVVFAIVGLIFLFAPDQVIIFFNSISETLGMAKSDLNQAGFYLALAVAYMYLVTLLAILMYRYPQNRLFILLLINAKLASAAISLFLFIVRSRYLIFLANGIVDGLIGAGLAVYYYKIFGKIQNELSSTRS